MKIQSILILIILILGSKAKAQITLGKYDTDENKRTEVHEDKDPHRFVCHLSVRRTFGTFPSTGFLISENVIITSGHTAGEWRKLFKNNIKEVTITLFEHFTIENEYKFIKEVTLKKGDLKGYGAHPEYHGKDMKSRPFDYGYFKLPPNTLPPSTTTGYFQLKEYEQAIVGADSLFITGYPGDKNEKKEGSLWLKGDALSTITVSDSFIAYGIFTFEGDSGAPIWLKSNNNFFVVGIHNTGFKTCNGGTKVTKDVITTIEGWIKK